MDFSVVARAGLTQREFAALTGVSRVTANTWVRGKMQPHRYIKARVAAMLEHMEAAVTHGDMPLPVSVPKGQRIPAARAAVRAAYDRKTAG